MKIEFTCLGSPKAQKRHRSTRVGKFIRNYDPSSGDKADFLGIVHKYAPEQPFVGTLKLQAYFYINYPKKWLRTGKYEGQKKPNAPNYCPTRPDVDNYLKFVMDAMGNGIFYNDDSKIALVEVAKKYSFNPRTEITIEEIDET